MTIAPILCLLLFCASMAFAQDRRAPVIACNLKAIGAVERPRYNDLMKRLRAAVRHRVELPEGFAYRLDGKAISLPEVGEWMTMERLCCPFLNFHLSVEADLSGWQLSLTGPPGVKALLREEFSN
jgi:hypothetical protein